MSHNISSLRYAILAGFISTAIMAVAPFGAAQAETIPFNEVILFSYNPEGPNNPGQYDANYLVDTIHSSPLTPASGAYSEAGGWGSVTTSGSADLATGQLKMQIAAAMGDGSAQISPYVKSNAIFGDGFRASTPGGQPFSWTSQSQAQFAIDLSGWMDISGDMTDSFHPGLFIILSILDPGTLDPNQRLINGPTAQQYHFWSIGDPNANVSYVDPVTGEHISLMPDDYYDELPGTLTYDFTPGGDFDWVLFLAGSGQVMEYGQSFDYDLSHTLDFSYRGPDDSVTRTVSGQFGGFDQVDPDPGLQVAEPETLLVLLGALGFFAFVRRRGHAHSGGNRSAIA